MTLNTPPLHEWPKDPELRYRYEERAGIKRVAELLQQQCLLDEAEICRGDVGPAEFGEVIRSAAANNAAADNEDVSRCLWGRH